MRNRGAVAATAVARAATRRIMLSEVSPQEDAPALLGPGVVGDETEPALTLETKGLELPHKIANAGCKVLRRDADGDGAGRIPLNKPCLLKIRQQDIARSEEHTSELQSLRHLVCRLL